ncbi:hypothetical protein ACLOJK_016572 [Asimina triloba]
MTSSFHLLRRRSSMTTSPPSKQQAVFFVITASKTITGDAPDGRSEPSNKLAMTGQCRIRLDRNPTLAAPPSSAVASSVVSFRFGHQQRRSTASTDKSCRNPKNLSFRAATMQAAMEEIDDGGIIFLSSERRQAATHLEKKTHPTGDKHGDDEQHGQQPEIPKSAASIVHQIHSSNHDNDPDPNQAATKQVASPPSISLIDDSNVAHPIIALGGPHNPIHRPSGAEAPLMSSVMADQ